MKNKRSYVLLILLPLSCFLVGFSFSDGNKVASYAQKQQMHEIINMLQPRIDKGEDLPPMPLYVLALAYKETRSYSKALTTIDLLQKRIDKGDKSIFENDYSVYPQILRGGIYLDLGEPQKAVIEGKLALKMLNSKGANRSDVRFIDTCELLGVSMALTGDTKGARKAIRLLESMSESTYYAWKYESLSRIYIALKDYPQALAAIRNPDAKVDWLISIVFDTTFIEIPKMFIFAKSLYETGKVKEAKEVYDKLLGHPQIEQIGGIYWLVLLDRSKIALAEGQTKTAEEMLKKAIDVIEKGRSSINTEAGRIGFVGDKQEVYGLLADLLLTQGRPAEAFSYVERAKSRALVDLLASQKNIAVHNDSGKQIRTTLTQIATLENDLSSVASAGDKEAQTKKRSVVLALRKDLREQAPEVAALVSVNAPDIAEIQNKLGPDETLVEYYFTGNNWHAFVLTKQGISAQKLTADHLEKDIDDLRKTIIINTAGTYKQYAQSLYRSLFVPVNAAVKTKKLIIVPHGALHYLSFAALADGNRFLIDRYSIRILPSASVLTILESDTKVPSATSALILGNPRLGDPKYDLRFAGEEALAVGRILPGSKVLLRSEATETSLKIHGGRFPIIHLAVHGTFDPDQPLHSALLLAADKNNDGVLKASDLYNLSLNADLVTLSACETALGKIAKGDDIIGFTRGFLYAGVHSLISSLWQVDDQATRDLMVDFYQNRKSMGKDEALRNAQLQLKKQYPHPYYWAAFVLTGSGI